MLVARGGRDVVRGVCEVTDDGRGGHGSGCAALLFSGSWRSSAPLLTVWARGKWVVHCLVVSLRKG